MASPIVLQKLGQHVRLVGPNYHRYHIPTAKYGRTTTSIGAAYFAIVLSYSVSNSLQANRYQGRRVVNVVIGVYGVPNGTRAMAIVFAFYRVN